MAGGWILTRVVVGGLVGWLTGATWWVALGLILGGGIAAAYYQRTRA